MIISVKEVKQFIQTTEPDKVLRAKLKALELLIRKHTNNNFQNRGIRFTCPVMAEKLLLTTDMLKVGDTLQLSESIYSNGVYGIRDKFTSIFDSAKEIVSNAIETIKGFFDFEWKLPEIKLPHFSISGNFSLNPPSIPSFGIEWYKDGGIMNDPTMFGFNPFSNKAMVGGEAGPEAIAPISTLQSYVRDAVSETNNKLYTVMNAVLSVLTQYLPELAHMQVVMDTGETVGVLATPMSEKLGKMTYMRERTN